MRFTAVVLAGGRSSRMGADKAFADLAGRPLVEWVLDALEPLTRSFVIVANDVERFAAYAHRARVVRDERPHGGPLPALATGLRHARDPWCLVATCDAPFLHPSLVQALARYARGHDAAVPGTPGERWPLTAFYHANACLPAIRAALARGDERIVGFYGDLRVRWVPRDELRVAEPELRSLWNLNTPADLEEARALVARARSAG